MDYLTSKYDLSVFNYYANKTFVLNTPPNVKKYEGGVIYPLGTPHKAGVFDSVDSVSELNESCEEVVYMGCFTVSHFGVVLIDGISRLWYHDNTKKYVYIAGNQFNSSYLLRFLDMLGIPENQVIRIATPTRFKCVIVPAISFIHGKYILNVYSTIFERMVSGMSLSDFPSFEKVYLTRRRLKKRKEIGERKFELFFRANGYEVIALEELSIEHQAAIMRNAKHIASLEGTHAHGIVWRNAGNPNQCTQVILRKQSECIPRQMMLNELWKVETSFIDVFEEPFRGFPISHDRGPFFLRWTKQIEQFAESNNMIIPNQCQKLNYFEYIEYAYKCGLYYVIHNLKKKLIHFKTGIHK